MRMRRRIGCLAVLLTSCLGAQTITTGEVAGVVKDLSGAIVPGAAVQLKSVDMGETRTSVSGATGLYRFVFVHPGIYEISASTAGLKSDTERLTAAVGQVQVLDLTLKVEASKETVVVSDVAPLLQTDNANTTYAVSRRQMELLP